MDSYQRMRSIGVSVETADALSSAVDALPPRKREAFFMWLCGYKTDTIFDLSGITRFSLKRIVITTRTKSFAKCPSSMPEGYA
jgi:hypothetical protein